MLLIFKVAFLNILRNSRRTLITVLAIVFGCVSLILFGGFVEYMYDGLRESMIHSQLGHIQVFKKGFEKHGTIEPEKYLLSQEETQKITAIIQQEEGVSLTTRRLNFSGLLSNGVTSLGVFGIGMEAEEEALINSAVRIVEGDDLFPEDVDGALLGKELAESLGVKAGEVMTLLAATTDGGMNAVDIKISGIMTTGVKEYDERIVRANLPHIQNLLYTDSITRMVVLLDKTEDTERILKRLEKRFEENGLDLEMKTWSDLAFFYHKVVDMFNGIFGFIRIIVLAIVIMGIANTMIMAVMERTSEIGTIRALGNTRSEVLALFLVEAIYLGVLGGAFGILIGTLSALGITNAEIMMPPAPGSTEGFPIVIQIVPEFLVEALILGIIASILSSIYPAIRASRLKIVDALRFV